MTHLTIVANNDLERFPIAWRRAFAAGRIKGRLREAGLCETEGKTKEAEHHFEKAARIR